MKLNERLSTLPIVVLGVLLGLALPGGGCAEECPEYEFEGSYSITGPYREDWVPDSARVEVSETAIVISYMTLDGSRWEVEYVRGEAPN